MAYTISSFGANTAASRGTVLTAPGSTNSKGAWTQLTASSGNVANWLALHVDSVTGFSDPNMLVDIGIGGAGAETVLIANLPIGRDSSQTYQAARFMLPVSIANGTRISARYQTSATGQNVSVCGHLIDNGYSPTQGTPSTYGANTTASTGTTITAGASANALSASWTELTTSSGTDSSHNHFVLCAINRSTSGVGFMFDLATGAPGAESNWITDIVINARSNNDDTSDVVQIPIELAAGTRIHAKARCSTGGTTADLILFGFKDNTSTGSSGSHIQSRVFTGM